MVKSNIIAGSNVYLVRTKIPFWDPDFVKQIRDPKILNDIKRRYKVETNVQKLDEKQMDISRRDRRCLYAKNDPCWGYDDEGKYAICKCINGKCAKIYECNPAYSKEYAETWQVSERDIQLYGDPKDPEKIPEYYLVDMISEEEMEIYDFLDNDGKINPVPPPDIYVNNWKQDKNGKRLSIVGYRWVITDNASYEGAELVPIWRPRDTEIVDSRKFHSPKKAKRIEKKNFDSDMKEDNVSPALSARKEAHYKAIEKIVIGFINRTVNLIDILNNSFLENKTTILLDNAAELALFSSYLLSNEILHGISMKQTVTLKMADQFKGGADNGRTIVSSNFLNNGPDDRNIQDWRYLTGQKDIIKLNIPKREYVNFLDVYGINRYGIKNLYGVTHICLWTDDISLLRYPKDGLNKINIINRGVTYEIVNVTGETIGKLKDEIAKLLKSLQSNGEISEMPDRIEGLALNVQKGNIDFLGIGHLVFGAY